MDSQLGLSFDGMDASRAPAAAEVVRLLRAMVGGPLRGCDVGADRAARRIRVRGRVHGELDARTVQRVAFWAARAGGRASTLSSAAEARLFELALARCGRVVREADPLRVFAAIRAEFPPGDGVPALTPMSSDAPVLSLHLDGPGGEGVTYDPRTRELFVPSPLAPPVGDELVLQIDAPGRWSSAARARVRVVEVRTPQVATPACPAGFAVALERAGNVHAALVDLCPSPIARERGRAAQRYRVNGRVHVRDAGAPAREAHAREGFLRDLSVSGAFIRTASPGAPGDRVEVEAELPNGAHLRTSATVVHARAEGMGVRFDEDATTALAATIAGLSGRRPRVLVVDDDVLARAMLGDAFRARGWDVLTAPDASFGLQTLTEDLFALDLLVTDVRMAGLDGAAFVRAIRQLGGESDLPIVAVTASLDDELRERLGRLGANAVLSKAGGPEAVAAAGAEVVEREQGRRALEGVA